MAPDDETRRRAFADLTAFFEDAAALAAEGQAHGLSRARARAIAQKIRRLVQRAERTTDALL